MFIWFVDIDSIYLELLCKSAAIVSITADAFYHYTMRSIIASRKNSSIDLEKL